MADFMTPKQRSRAMSKVKGEETKIEQTVRSLLHRRGFRFRKNVKNIPGKPDIVLPKYKAIVFIHGCFWHHHPGCAKSKLPETRKEFWKNKIQGNIDRDKKNIEILLSLAWRVGIIWECALKKAELVSDPISELTDWIISEEDLCEIHKPFGASNSPLVTCIDTN